MVSTAAFHARVRGSVPGLGGLKETKLFLPHPRVKVSIVGSLRDREVACSASDRQGSSFESCVCRTVSSQSSHHPQEVLLAQLSLYVHKGGLKPDSFHLLTKYRPIIYIFILSGVTQLLIIRNSHFGRMCFKSVKTLRVLHSKLWKRLRPSASTFFTAKNVELLGLYPIRDLYRVWKLHTPCSSHMKAKYLNNDSSLLVLACNKSHYPMLA